MNLTSARLRPRSFSRFRCRSLLACLGSASFLGLLAPAAIAQTLPVTDGLSLWLRADEGVTADASGAVTAWADQSGKANHASQADTAMAPTRVDNALNSKPVLRFDGSDDFLEVQDSDTVSNAGDLTTLYVVKFDDFATYRAVWAKTAANLPGATDFYALPNTGVPRLYRGNGSSSGLASFDGLPLRAGAYFVSGFGIEGNQASHFLSDQITASGTLNADVADADTPLLIGTRQDNVTRLKGDIAEILVYDRALSPTERASVVDYLARKYDIQNLPPTITIARSPSGATLDAGTVVTLTATATDSDGRIDRVEFLGNGSVIATAVAPPYRARVTVRTSGSYRFAARAVDDKDGKATSPDLVANVSGPATTPTLDVKSNLQLWLAADSGVIAGASGQVASWFDASGQSNDAFQSDGTFAPLFVENAVAGLPAVRFDGADDYLDVADSDSLSIDGDITSLFVVKMDNFATFRSVWGKTQLNQPAPTDYYMLPGSGIPRLYRGNAQGSLGFVDGGSPVAAGAFSIAGFASTQSNVVHVLNGSVTGRGVINATPADLDTALKIGTRDDFVTLMQGDLAELLIYSAGLSTEDLDKVQLYLGEKYKIGLLVPTNTAPTVAVTSPLPNATFASPATVEISATAADSDGAVARVEFLVNGAVAATDTTAPFSASVTFPTADESLLAAAAYDNFGVRTVSEPVAITVTSTTTVALPKPARLKLWLKADAGITSDAGSVGVWEDQSGNLNHAQQTDAAQRPQLVASALNGRPALRFDGENDALAIPHSLSLAMVGDLTTYFVVKVDDFDTFRAVWAKTDGNQPRATDFYVVPSTGIPRALRGGGGSGSVDGTTPLVAGEYAIVGFDMAGGALRHWLNGAPNGEGAIAGPFADTGKPLRIGTRDDGATRLRGDLAELLIYNTSLGDADRASVVSYLGNKYAIGVPAGPPQLVIARAANGTQVTLSWPANATDYVLQSSDRIPGGSWQAVPGVTGSSATLPIGAVPAYFRLAKP